ncbi:class I SAM-dependent methyltransferase [Caulobacter sp. RL271]|jgi:ubiquinone/menaquinone biosynthesis C-methylase UbiE|uniref:Class I SAM-dependent methyltransferase n=1 Tax=Caulobacter segnis TaxID=88688 RepID=A0ABY4ZYP1_9CAUL|nr:class I SAM-dependent methyltransferase [Caulobacter segnis]USQ97875.1 class I SAM-dependent methyltransferase [Caulobacter segnis]
MTGQVQYVPALGRPELTGAYDLVVSLATRERRWRGALLAALAPADGETIVDIGCGTGSQAIAIKRARPLARVVGIDPDPAVLAIARAKAERAGARIEWIQGLGDQADVLLGQGVANAVISSLVLHQCDAPVKGAILRAMARLSRPGGRVLIADYGRQRGLMRLLFRMVQAVDGFERTEFNATGALPGLMRASGLTAVSELDRIATPTGSISLYAMRAG